MKKVLALIAGIFLVTGIVFAQQVPQTQNPIDVLMNKLIEKYKDVKEMSAVIEMNMSMMGMNMKMPMKLWMKGDLFRMDMTMSVPGIDKPMEQIMLSDGKTISTYTNISNTVTVIDLAKLPEDARKKIKQSYNNSMGFDAQIFEKIKEQVKLEETMKNGKKVYLITIDDIEAIKKCLNMPGAETQMPITMKKLVYSIDYNTLVPVRMEIYTESETPGMWIDFIELKTQGVPDSIFNVSFPADAKKMDMTESVKGMLSK